MTDSGDLIKVFCRAAGAVKRTSFLHDSLDPSSYLGGDLGIDSIEMLEIWYRMEKELKLKLPDEAKRDVYTAAEVLSVFERSIKASEPDVL